jgi:hypothetical protein
MSYGDTRWQAWVLDEKTGIEHIKAAFDAGINAFDTADVSLQAYVQQSDAEDSSTHPDLLQRRLGADIGQSDQTAQPPARGDRVDDEGV